jgi:D-beta-D-heptose 7-phosphate kinase/D-beta-D-heptose 1-phosphate adenosyltransferase
MPLRSYESKIVDLETAADVRRKLGEEGKTVVFTNGCFDILHAGHLDYLFFAREQGDALIVGMNTDASVKRNKGEERPVVPEDERARMLAALEAVDFVVLFDEDEPRGLLEAILPDILVKGEDWSHYVAGRDIVEGNGGKVVLAPVTEGRSTTNIIQRIKESG